MNEEFNPFETHEEKKKREAEIAEWLKEEIPPANFVIHCSSCAFREARMKELEVELAELKRELSGWLIDNDMLRESNNE